MDQKNCVGNILFFKNVWRGPLCSRRAGSLVIKLLTRVLGRYNVKSVNRIKQNRELNQCFLHPVHCHNCRAVNCFFQTLKILLWTCEDQIGADTIFQRSVFIACSFKKKKKRQNRHLWCKYPTSWPAVLLNHEECLSPGISFSRQSKRQERAPRKSGVPSECCSVQAAPGSSNGQWLPTWGVLFRDWCNSVIPVNQTLPLMLKFRHSLSFGGICILTIPIFQRCQTREKGCLFFSLHWQFCLHLWTVKAKCLSSKISLDVDGKDTEFFYACFCFSPGMLTYRGTQSSRCLTAETNGSRWSGTKTPYWPTKMRRALSSAA